MYYQNFIRKVLLQLFDPIRAEKYYKFAYYPITQVVDLVISDGFLNNKKLDAIYQEVLAMTLDQYKGENKGEIKKWNMNHIMFAGKLPAWLGLDVGPLPTNHCEECVKVGVSRCNQQNASAFISQV